MTYTPLYIATTDITDSIARDFVSGNDSRLDIWMERTDEEVQALAMSLGVGVSSIVVPVNYRIKEYAISYYCFHIFQDCYGKNEVEDNDNDIYKLKLSYYNERVNFLRPQITKDIHQHCDYRPVPIADGQLHTDLVSITWLAHA
jgi:hypothetical protein